MPPGPAQKPANPTTSGAGDASLSLAGKRVVIVDDDGMTQMQVRKALKRAGLVVAGAAANGEDGLRVVLDERPDIVLMDIRMPRMGGLEATRRILDTYLACVIMMTAYPQEEHHAWARQIGAYGFVTKPITYDVLLLQMQAAYAAYAQAVVLARSGPPAANHC